MKELFNATNKSKTITVQVFEKRRRYVVRWDEYGIKREDIYRDVDSAVSLFNMLINYYRLDNVTIIGDKHV